MRMWTKRCLLVTLGMAALAGCTGGSGYTGIGSETRFYADNWIYYDDDDEYFFAGLTDEEKEALKQEWDSLSPEERQQIHDRWNDLSDDERSRVRQAWGDLDATQRHQVLSSMDTRARDGTLRSVVPVQARPNGGSVRNSAGPRTSPLRSGGFGGGSRAGGRGGFGGGGGRGGRR
jgi:predicted Fe-S protein YdhL (DUF1289 family)